MELNREQKRLLMLHEYKVGTNAADTVRRINEHGAKELCFIVNIVVRCVTSYNWIADPTLRSVSLWESLQSHPVFSVSVPLLFILFTAFGIHRRVVEPSIIARRCRESLSYFSLSCDDNGKLIVKPTVRMSSP